MKAIAQDEIIALIADINSFAQSSDELIASTQGRYASEYNSLCARHKNELARIESTYSANCAAIRDKTANTISEAKKILSDINNLDSKLSKADKYYLKTKTKKQAELAGTTSSKYKNCLDYFEALEKIKTSFNALYRKYSEDILPGLLNGLNYLFSSKRKQDYEELIILRNTVVAFVKEIEELLPELCEENLSSLKTDYLGDRSSAIDRHNAEASEFENQRADGLNAVAAKICDNLDAILPDELVSYLAAVSANFTDGIYKVNSGSDMTDEALNMFFIDYPADLVCASPLVAAVVKDKCAALLCGQALRFPIITSKNDAPSWVISCDNSNATAARELMHSMMFGFLSCCPVSRLSFTVIDPENRGNSVSPFFDARKKLPELFGESISITQDEVSSVISKLNEKIDGIVQQRLGNGYETIYEYAENTPGYSVSPEVLVICDFPRGFDERTLSDLRNVLRNGSRCGIYTVISYLAEPPETNRSQEYLRAVNSVLELSSVIMQNGNEFTLRSLPIHCEKMPDKNEFAKFFSKYMLIFEGIKNRGIAFSPLIRKLIEAKNEAELAEHMEYICAMQAEYEKTYARVPDVKTAFPRSVTLGSVLYPADIFSDSVGFEKICKSFGVEKQLDTENTSFVELPLTFDLRNSFNLLLECSEEKARGIVPFTHHVMWSLLSFMPVTKVNICVFDAEQRGNSIIPFLDFRKKAPDVFDTKIYTNADEMQERLRKINNRIDEFIQEKLGNRYTNILDYNLATPARAEPVTLLLLYDFPGGMDGRSIDLLTNILRNGSKCGVFTVICHNPDVPFSRYESIDERLEQIAKYCASVDYRDGRYCLLPYNLQVNIPKPLSYDAADDFVADYLEKTEQIKKQGLSFRDIIAKDLFSMSSSRSLKIPVGVGDGDSIVSLTVGEGSSHHGLIAGATGSGKSTLLHTLIMSSMLHYSPDELHLYLMDFKSGTEFKIYESRRLPHIQLLALDAMQEFGESILENLVSEMEERARLFKEANGVTKIKDYVSETGKPMPRILVIMDEFQILFNDASNRKVAMNCAELAKRIVTEGRAFGIHLLMATQSTKVISDLTLSHGTIEQMRIRIGLKCGESDARYLFSDEHDTKALEMMKGPIGTAVMNLDYTEQSNIGFRAAYCDDATQAEYLDLIAENFKDYPYTLRTFEGGRTTGLLEYFKENSVGLCETSPVSIHMGTLIKVAPAFVIPIDKKRKHNMLVCGANEKMSGMLTDNYMICALINRNSTVYCIDGDCLVGDNASAPLYEVLSDNFSRFNVAADRGDIIRFINRAYEDYKTRKKQNSSEVTFVVIKNLQFLDIVKTMFAGTAINESEYLDDGDNVGDVLADAPTSDSAAVLDPFAEINKFFSERDNDSGAAGDGMGVTEKLQKLIDDGSGYGIYFVVSSLDYQTVRESMYYGENILTKFPERVIFSLGSNDADNLIDGVAVAGLRENTVYYTDGIKNTFQMKPYTTPDAQALSEFVREEIQKLNG